MSNGVETIFSQAPKKIMKEKTHSKCHGDG